MDNIFIKRRKKSRTHALFDSLAKSELATKSKDRLRSTGRIILSYFLLIIVAIIEIPLLNILAQIMDSQKKIIWRIAAIANLYWFFKLAGLEIEIERIERNEKKPCIFAANHQSNMDGLILFYVLGYRTAVFIAPSRYYPFPFSFWFKKMGFIDVQRSDIEEIKYEDAHHRPDTIRLAAYEMAAGNSILIFPEGHVELDAKVTYFHTGAARIALYTGAGLVPLAIVDDDNVLGRMYLEKPGRIKVVFGQELDLSEYCFEKKLNVKAAMNRIKDEIIKMLPQKYHPLDYKIKNQKKICAIFNINGTIFRHDAQVELFKFLYRTGRIRISHLLHFFTLSMMKRLKYLDEKKFVYRLNGLLLDYNARDFYTGIKNLFDRELKLDIYEKIKVIIKDHHEKGHRIIILSSLVAPLVHCFADYLNANYWVGTILEEKNNVFTGRPLFIVSSENKKITLKKIKAVLGIDLDKSFVYGHDMDDLEMIRLAKFKYLINPGPEMDAAIKENDINIIRI
jgi:HAD superfamily phosphoserine phosphatase-like hydrolase